MRHERHDNAEPAPCIASTTGHRGERSAVPHPGLRVRQLEFATALLAADRPVPPGLNGPDGEPCKTRFDVYRNNVVAGLCDALKAAFPATRRIVGDEFFTAMACIYVSREPPRSPVMLDYGAGFADFIGAFEPASPLPYLRDVAHLERMWVEAYHAAEAAPLDLAAFVCVSPEQLPSIRLALHPSVRVIRSSFPVASVWQMNIEGGVPTFVDIDADGEDALIARPIAEVEVRVLLPGAATFIAALASGAQIVGATESARVDDPLFDLSNTLATLLTAGGIVGWDLTTAAPHADAAGLTAGPT